VVWSERDKLTLLDGHNRHEICERVGIEYQLTEMEFHSRQEALDWICRNQLGRRNLSPVDASELRGRMYNGRKKTKAQAGAKGGASKDQNDTCLESTAEVVAKETGVSAPTIKRDGKYAEAVATVAATVPEIREKVRSGEVSKARVVEAAKTPEKAAEVISRPSESRSEFEYAKAIERLNRAVRSELDKWPDEHRAEAVAWVKTIIEEYDV
jgi:hypothetical protein